MVWAVAVESRIRVRNIAIFPRKPMIFPLFGSIFGGSATFWITFSGTILFVDSAGEFHNDGIIIAKMRDCVNLEYEWAYLSNSWYRDGFINSVMLGLGFKF